MSRTDGDFEMGPDDQDLPMEVEPAPIDADFEETFDETFDEPFDDVVEPSRSRRRRKKPVEAEDLLDRLYNVIAGARSLPLSASVSINRDEVLDLIDEARNRLPDELRDARWLRKEREEYLAKMQDDGESLMAEARAQAERMVQRTEVVKAAEHRARRILDGAEAEARRLRLECEDYCDQKLAGFEIVLERTLHMVGKGRTKLQASNVTRPDPGVAAPELER